MTSARDTSLAAMRPNKTARNRRYELHEQIGSGGFSTVWRATDHLAGRQVAIKVSSRSRLDNPALTEAAILAELNHPHVIRLLDHFKTQKHFYLVFELLEGKELFDHIVRDCLRSRPPFSR